MMKVLKRLFSIIFGISIIVFFLSLIYSSFDVQECNNQLQKQIFVDNTFREDNGLPLIDREDFEEKIENNGFNIILLNEKQEYPLLKEMIYYCHTNSIKDTYIINNEFIIECRLYFNEPKKSRFTRVEKQKRTIIDFFEAYELLINSGLYDEKKDTFYGNKLNSM